MKKQAAISAAVLLTLLSAGRFLGLTGAGMEAEASPPAPLPPEAHPEAHVAFPEAVQIGGDTAVVVVNYTVREWPDSWVPAPAGSDIFGDALYLILPDGLEIASAGFAEADVEHVMRAGHPDEFAMREYRADASSAARDGWALWEVEIRAAGPPVAGSAVTAGAWGTGYSASLSASDGTVSLTPQRNDWGMAGVGWMGTEMAAVPAAADALPVMPPMDELAEHLRDAIPPGTDAAAWLRLYAPFLTEQYVSRLLAEHPEIGSRGSGGGSARGASGQSGGLPPLPPGPPPPPPGSGLGATQYHLSGALDVRAANGTMKGVGGVGVCFYDADNGMSGAGAKPTLYRVGGGGHPSAWTSLSGSVVPPDPLKPHRSFVVQLQVNLTGYDFENKNMDQRVSYNPSCIGQGAGGASGQGAGGASGQAPAPSIAHDSAGSPAVSTLIIAPAPVEN